MEIQPGGSWYAVVIVLLTLGCEAWSAQQQLFIAVCCLHLENKPAFTQVLGLGVKPFYLRKSNYNKSGKHFVLFESV